MAHLMLVEDSPTQAMAAQMRLRDAGFDVELARDAETALRRLREAPFDLMVSDIVMPGLDGYELCRIVKADVTLADMPVILVTSLRDPLEVIRALECGADALLNKSAGSEALDSSTADHLVQRVHSLLANRELRQHGDGQATEVHFLGRRFTVTAPREQTLNLLMSVFEDMVHKNRQYEQSQTRLAAAQRTIEQYARQLEGQVRDWASRHQMLMARARDAVLVVDEGGAVQEVNHQAVQLMGRPEAAMVGRRLSELGLLSDEQLRTLSDDDAEPVTTTVDHPDRGVIHVECSMGWGRLDDRRLGMMIARDVTRRLHLERQLAQSRRVEAIGQLAGGIAHDFNNILTVILGYSELLQARLGDDPAVQGVLTEILDAGRRAADMTGQLLTFSRRSVPHNEPLNVNDVLSDLIRMLRRLLGGDIVLVTDLTPDPAPILANRSQLEQVVMNLVINARDAMPRGGRLIVRTANVELEARDAEAAGCRPGPHVMLSVIDTGAGIPREIVDRIFDPFFTTKKPGRGTGLGLATVYGIVTQNRGGIRVHSQPDHGTTFHVYLPHAPRGGTASRPEPSAPAPRRGSPPGTALGEILLVDDDQTLRRLAEQILNTAGYRVTAAAHGGEALDIAQRQTRMPDLVLSDIIMPVMDGATLAQRLRQIWPDVPVLLISGSRSENELAEVLRHPNVDFMPKPFSPEQLLERVGKLLQSAPGDRA